MTKQELIEKVARSIRLESGGLPHELNKKVIALVVDAVFGVIGEYFVKAKLTRRETPRFTFPGFGTFTKKRRTGRMGRNPRNGELIEIPASTTVSFAPGVELRAHLNRTALKHNS